MVENAMLDKDVELLVANKKACDMLVVVAKENLEVLTRIELLKKELANMQPTDDDAACESDKKIFKLLKNLKKTMMKEIFQPYLTKTNPLLKQLEIEVAGRGFEKIVNNKIFNPDDFVIENGVLTEYKGKGGVVVLPDNVESVGEKVFSGNKDILKLVADDCLVRIKPYAFEMCQNLQEVFLAPAVVSLEESSFYNCNVLEKVVMGDGLKSIGKYAFAKCPNLKEVSFAEGLSEIGDKAFFLDDNLSKSIRKTIKKINKDALR